MADLTDEEFASVVASIGGLPSNLLSETGRMVAELQRHRAAQAADPERIRAVVLDVAYDELLASSVDHVSIARAIATRVAEQLTGSRKGG